MNSDYMPIQDDEQFIIVKKMTALRLKDLRKKNTNRQNRIDTYDDVVNRYIK